MRDYRSINEPPPIRSPKLPAKGEDDCRKERAPAQALHRLLSQN